MNPFHLPTGNLTCFLASPLRPGGRRTATCVVGLVILLSSLGRPAAAAELRAGTARRDITPTEPVRLAGYGSRNEPSRGVHDPLSARALALEQDGRRLVLVSLDNLGFYNDTAEPLRAAILEALGLEPSALMLCAIHTHSAPTLTLDAEKGYSNNVAYTRALQKTLVELVQQALAQSGPVELAVASGSSPVGVNRREVVPDGAGGTKVVLGRNPSVLMDREVQVLRLARLPEREVTAMLFAYATHSTSLGPGNYLVSGDVHGLAEQFLERYFGNGVIAPGFAGASGNIDPWVRVLPGFRDDRGWIPEPVLMGTMLGQEVARVAEGMKAPVAANGPIRSTFKTVMLPAKVDEAAAAAEPTRPFKLTVGRVGEVAFVGFGGEVFNEIGQAVKAASPFRSTFIFTHCNGAAGYVPTRASYGEDGYEVQSTPFAAGADEQLIQATLDALRGLE